MSVVDIAIIIIEWGISFYVNRGLVFMGSLLQKQLCSSALVNAACECNVSAASPGLRVPFGC